jgi:hypothetical protein
LNTYFFTKPEVTLAQALLVNNDSIGYLSARKDYLWQTKRQNNVILLSADRTYIEQELVRGSSFINIARALGKDPSTISKEVKLHYEVHKASIGYEGCRNYINYSSCIHRCKSLRFHGVLAGGGYKETGWKLWYLL